MRLQIEYGGDYLSIKLFDSSSAERYKFIFTPNTLEYYIREAKKWYIRATTS